MLGHEADAEHRVVAEARTQAFEQARRRLRVDRLPEPLEQACCADLDWNHHRRAQADRLDRRQQRRALETLPQQQLQVACVAARPRQADHQARRCRLAVPELDGDTAHARGPGPQECLQADQQLLEGGHEPSARDTLRRQVEALIEAFRCHRTRPQLAPPPKGLVQLIEQRRAKAPRKSVARQAGQVGHAAQAEGDETAQHLVRPAEAGQRQARGDGRQALHGAIVEHEARPRDPQRRTRRRGERRLRLETQARESGQHPPAQRRNTAKQAEAAAHLGQQRTGRLEADHRRELGHPAGEAFEQGSFDERLASREHKVGSQHQRGIHPEARPYAEAQRGLATGHHDLPRALALDDRACRGGGFARRLRVTTRPGLRPRCRRVEYRERQLRQVQAQPELRGRPRSNARRRHELQPRCAG